MDKPTLDDSSGPAVLAGFEVYPEPSGEITLVMALGAAEKFGFLLSPGMAIRLEAALARAMTAHPRASHGNVGAQLDATSK